MSEHEEETAQTAGVVHDWSAYYDDEGRLYYYNSVTDESSWEPPEHGNFNPAEKPEEDKAEDAAATNEDAQTEDVNPEYQNSEEANSQPQHEQGTTEETSDEPVSQWIAYKDEEGREYYYNATTGETQWEKPDENVVAAEDLEVEEVAAETETQPADNLAHSNALEHDSAHVETQPLQVEAEGKHEPRSPLPEEETKESMEQLIDPEVQRVQDAEAALNQTDSILEPSCISNVAEVVRSEGGQPQKAITSLIDNYHGQTAICGLLGRWLADFRTSATASTDPSSDGPSQESTDEVREITQGVISRFVKERFSKETGDRILNLSKAEAAFLEDMMDSSRWRKLLIDLSAVHKGSAVLIYCLQAISKRGHHREIAKRVNQSDHFAVFNAMLQSELTNIGNISVSAENDISSALDVEDVVEDLKRACCSTSYTYLYSMEALRHLHARAKEVTKDKKNSRLQRAVRKWHALSQTLESAMVDPSSTSNAGGGSHLFRKRRLDVALTISELHQRERRRLKTSIGLNQQNSKETSKQLETALLNFLRRHSVGMQLDDAALDPLLPSGIDITSFADTGRLLVEHPVAIKALLEHLFKPGSTRVVAPVLRNKCARLVAFAVLSAEKTAGEDEVLKGESSDEVALTRMIVQASQVCEQLETMVSFLILLYETKSGTSPGEKLCSLALNCAAIAQGVVIWAQAFTNGTDFANSPAFPTISVSILSLLRIVSMKHPFTRGRTIDVAVNFLGHSNPDISYQKVTTIKEQSIRLLIFLLLEGEISDVLGKLSQKMQKHGSSDLDASLIRYFVGGLLECARPPVSSEFVRCFGLFLKAPKCIDAVRSSYFTDQNQQLLSQMLLAFETAAAPEDKSLVSTLLSAYKVERES